jgi:hypothetical protein
MLNYFAAKEIIFTFITFLLGKDSPCYGETLIRHSENWDYGRPYIHNYEPIVELINELFLNSTENKLQDIKNVSLIFYIANSTLISGY